MPHSPEEKAFWKMKADACRQSFANAGIIMDRPPTEAESQLAREIVARREKACERIRVNRQRRMDAGKPE